ncbi:MAG: hypothetical protein AAB847_01130 [Patescibacteria group bacterium]
MKKLLLISFVVLLLGIFSFNIIKASHSWGNFHWFRSVNPAMLAVGDNVSSVWDGYLNTAIGDWNSSTAVRLNKALGLTNPKNCRPVAGRIEVCNSRYGNNGWLGIAQVWVNGDHIMQATSKMNDTYFNTSRYNTPAWRRMVMCQELAHDFGLDHQDENFSNPNLGTCMDYTDNPSGPPSNEHPNAHDYGQLEIIYAHLDSAMSALASKINNGNQENNETDFSDQAEWGKELRKDSRGRTSLYERDLGHGKKVITHVLWVDDLERE